MVTAALIALAAASSAHAQPVPPCAGEPAPAYADAGAAPNVGVWFRDALEHWTIPDCIGWTASSLDAISAAAVRFRAGSSAEIVARFAAVSQYASIQYWSPNGQDWRPLIHRAHALTAAENGRPRPDFSSTEVAAGPVSLRMGGSGVSDLVYRLRILVDRDSALVVSIENVDAVRILGVSILREGGGQFLFTFEQESNGLWRGYVLVRVGSLLNAVARPAADQYANRAVALLRHFTGLPHQGEAP